MADSTSTAAVRAFFRGWGSPETFRVAFEDHLAVECRWDQRPMLVTRSRAGALAFLRVSRVLLRLSHCDVEMRHVAADGATVSTERIDHLLRPDGTLIASLPVAGVLRLDDDGRIVEWREYFHVLGLLRQVAVNTCGAGVTPPHRRRSAPSALATTLRTRCSAGVPASMSSSQTGASRRARHDPAGTGDAARNHLGNGETPAGRGFREVPLREFEPRFPP